MLGKDVDMLVPEPIESQHSKLFKMAKFGGRMLARKSTRNLLMKSNSEYLVPIDFGLRLNWSMNSDLQYVGIVNFNKKQLESTFVLLLNKDGLITGMTNIASYQFQIGKNIKEYNEDFQQIFKVKKSNNFC